MLPADKERIAMLRSENFSYQFIADKLGLSMNTVKSICRRNGIKALGKRKTKAEKEAVVLCKNCLMPLKSDGRKGKAFCSDYCRTVWRRKNLMVFKKTT